MSLWSRLFYNRPKLPPEYLSRLDKYRKLEEVDSKLPVSAIRFVVLDVETTGLNPFQDHLLTIGAVALDKGMIQFKDSFETVLRQHAPSGHRNILVHGIDGTTQMSGREPALALLGFLEFAGKAPLVGFHADFDRVMIERAARRELGMAPVNTWLDLAILAPALLRRRAPAASTLDDWAHAFGLENHARHNAAADALVTAQLLQIVLDAATQEGITTCAELVKLERGERWLGRR